MQTVSKGVYSPWIQTSFGTTCKNMTESRLYECVTSFITFLFRTVHSDVITLRNRICLLRDGSGPLLYMQVRPHRHRR